MTSTVSAPRMDELMDTDTDVEAEWEMPVGFPRPRVTAPGYVSLPLSYTAASPRSPGTLDWRRNEESTEQFLCQMCGLEVVESRCGVATAAPGPHVEKLFINEDHGLTHEKCARMVVQFCPAFRPDWDGDTRMAMWVVDRESLREQWAWIMLGSIALDTLTHVESLAYAQKSAPELQGLRMERA